MYLNSRYDSYLISRRLNLPHFLWKFISLTIAISLNAMEILGTHHPGDQATSIFQNFIIYFSVTCYLLLQVGRIKKSFEGFFSKFQVFGYRYRKSWPNVFKINCQNLLNFSIFYCFEQNKKNPPFLQLPPDLRLFQSMQLIPGLYEYEYGRPKL